MSQSNSERSRWFVDEVLPQERELRSWLSARFGSAGEVDDMIQEVFSRILKAHESGPIANPRAFLFVTARNLALNQLRHMRYERPGGAREIDPLSIVADVNSPPEAVAKEEELQQLIQAIQSLPKRCRQVVTLRKIYGLSQKEVAKRLGISVHTVEAQGSIGLRKCIEYFRSHGYLSHLEK
ncbi:sigma-70 family RNA polymerase sigma factor [Puniceicoccaceae bacterium K14]|nr:sigma-70 family RNA polymerase sigma factor [Puniceicoccaceae bacterium K14]